jgi:hypothetical protein
MNKNKLTIQWEKIYCIMSTIFSKLLKDIKIANKLWMISYRKTDPTIYFKVLENKTCLKHPTYSKKYLTSTFQSLERSSIIGLLLTESCLPIKLKYIKCWIRLLWISLVRFCIQSKQNLRFRKSRFGN